MKISETMQPEAYTAVLLHEIGHARSGETDIPLGFEQKLAALLGKVAAEALCKASARTKEPPQEPAKSQSLHLTDAWRQPQAASRQTTPEQMLGFWARLFGKC